jgi:hypothetical protein
MSDQLTIQLSEVTLAAPQGGSPGGILEYGSHNFLVVISKNLSISIFIKEACEQFLTVVLAS